jgi:6-phosphofructokinase 1
MVLNGQFGQMVAYHHPNLVAVPLAEAIAKPNLVTIDSDLVNTAKGVDISLGI